jgi:hypothetical protein
LGFKTSYADPDVWMHPGVKGNGFMYYEYILVYVDDLLIISHQAILIVNTLKSQYRLKDDEVGKPKTYLGAHVKEFHLPKDRTKIQWGLSAEQYIKNAIKNVEDKINESGQTLLSKKYASTPLSNKYRPELDYSPLLNGDAANYYQQLIGVLRWIVELRGVDIHIYTAMMSSHMIQPREGHLKEVLHIFAYLKHHASALMVFDDVYVNWDENSFPRHSWTNYYRDAKEELPPNMPQPRGNAVHINCVVDADQAGNCITG